MAQLELLSVFARAMKPRSNSIGLLAGAGIGVSLMFAASRWDDGSKRLLWRSGLVGFAFVPFAIALAELRSGYAWKNLAPGNRGVSRTESPRRYWLSVAGHTVIALRSCAFWIAGYSATVNIPNHALQPTSGSGFASLFTRLDSQWLSFLR